MTLMIIVACSVFVLLDSPALAGEPPFPMGLAAGPHLQLPKLTGLKIVPLGAPLAQPQIPPAFFGCWVGDPRKFDTVRPARKANSLYRVHRITKCYLPGRIETQEFTLELTPTHPMMDSVLGWLSLDRHRTAVAGEETGIYQITANQIYSRGTLTLSLTAASLFSFPHSIRTTVIDEEIATLVDPDNLTIVGRTFLTAPEPDSVGTWHAHFHH